MKIFKKTLSEPLNSQNIFRKKYPNYIIGKSTYGVPRVHDWNEGSTLQIGSYCSISDNVQIYLGGHHRSDWITTYPFPAFYEKAKHIKDYGGTNGDVIIGSDVWIAANVIILSGVTIGHGAVIANGSIVTKNIAPYEIVGGDPAKHIRYRFTPEIITLLLSLSWWELDETEILEIASILCSQDIQKLVEYSKIRKKHAD